MTYCVVVCETCTTEDGLPRRWRYLCEDCQQAEGSVEPWHDVICECTDGVTVTERPLVSYCDSCRTNKPVAVFRESTVCPECGSITTFSGRCSANCSRVGV